METGTKRSVPADVSALSASPTVSAAISATTGVSASAADGAVAAVAARGTTGTGVSALSASPTVSAAISATTGVSASAADGAVAAVAAGACTSPYLFATNILASGRHPGKISFDHGSRRRIPGKGVVSLGPVQARIFSQQTSWPPGVIPAKSRLIMGAAAARGAIVCSSCFDCPAPPRPRYPGRIRRRGSI